MESSPLNSPSPLCPPPIMASAIGQSAIERLPLEIIHDIHFLDPDNALLATSKTMAAKFTASVLPVARTSRWVIKLMDYALSYDYLMKDHRDSNGIPIYKPRYHINFILSRAYTHSPRIIHMILCKWVPTEILHSLAIMPPFDPSNILEHSAQTLPIDLIHYIYHTYPTCGFGMSQALRAALAREDWELATALLDCGGDPRPGREDTIKHILCKFTGSSAPNRRYKLGPKAQEIVDNWTYKEIRNCSCGWTAKPVPYEDSEFTKQLCVLRKNPKARINYNLVPPPPEPSNNPLWPENASLFSHHRFFYLWKLPPSLELGRNWCLPGENLADTVEAFHEIFHPKRRTLKRRLFFARGGYEYAERVWALFGDKPSD